MKQEDTTNITARCFHGELASCSHSCPFFFDIRTFLTRARDGKWGLAYKLYRNATIFPAIVSELCDAPCRAECQRGPGPKAAVSLRGAEGDAAIQGDIDVTGLLREARNDRCKDTAFINTASYFVGDEPVDIRAIEAAAVRFARDRRPENYRIPPRTQRVAVIGAGAAGLSLALNLAQKAYPVTIFERGKQALWSWAGHPKYESFLDEIFLQFSSVEAEFVYGHEIAGPDDPSLAEYDAIYYAAGANGISGFNRNVFDRGRVFSGGGLIGQDVITAIAYGVEASQKIESWLQTGERRFAGVFENNISAADGAASGRPEKHYLDHTNEKGKELVIAADPLIGYTKEEAELEASRCMGCDCRACMDACEMLGRYNKRPQKIAIEAFSDTRSAPPFSSCTLTRQTYSCNLCGNCKTVCPVGVDLEKLFHIARTGRAETGKQPRIFHDFWLRDFEWSRTEGAFFSTNTDINPSNANALNSSIFFPGCKLGARSPSQVRDAAAFLKEKLNAGIILDCCGAPAYWAGEEELFQAQLDRLRKAWESAGKPVFVLACAYCMRLFAEFLPDIEIVSLYELLLEKGLFRHALFSFTVFDPCTSRGFPKMEAAVRKLANNMGISITELNDKNRCCGYGGHMRTANPELYNTIVANRSSAGEDPYLVYCANCAETFAIEGKSHAHILDLVFPDTYNLFQTPVAFQRRRDNAVLVKSILSELYKGKPYEPEPCPWDGLRVDIPAALTVELNRRLILAEDLKEAIYEAERSGKIFVLPGGAPNGGELRQCRLIRDVVVTWVQYTKRNIDDYSVIDAWSHRMRFSDTE